MLYVIDYRNGSMGHTILAHTLFACNKINVDIDQIFSNTGDAHFISSINQTNLRCNHNLEMPLTQLSTQILSVVCADWDEVLRKSMAYHKHYKLWPTEHNLNKFEFKFNADMNPLEYLSIAYFDSYPASSSNNAHVLQLGQYLEHQLESLQSQVQNVLGWQWDNLLSETFHKRVLVHNHKYLQWLDSIKHLVDQTLRKNVTPCNLQFWEKAIVISMSCKQHNVHPSSLHWDNWQFLNSNNHGLIESLNACSDAVA